jgi:hypothetical protein
MFWNRKKKYVEANGLPVVLSLRGTYDFMTGRVTKGFLAYKWKDVWCELVGYEEYKEKTDLLENKLDLILNHLNLEYVPETEKKEPAKLVEKLPRGMDILNGLYPGCIVSMTGEIKEPKKKKAGRPKKKK